MTTEFKVDGGIPLPPRPGRRRYPFAEMKVGDSFFVPNIPIGKLASAARHYKKNGERYASRREGDGVRIWRIA